MELLFVDESGDNGFEEGSSAIYALAGVSLEACHWKESFWRLRNLKQLFMQKYGAQIDELKCNDLFTHRGQFFSSPFQPKERQWIYEQVMDTLLESQLNLFATLKRKEILRKQFVSEPKDKLVKLLNESVWRSLLTLYEEHLIEKSLASGQPQNGLVYCDISPAKKQVRSLVRAFARRLNEQNEHPTAGIIEDAVMVDSRTSYFIQSADFLAFSVRRIEMGLEQEGDLKIKPELARRLKDKVRFADQ